LIAGCFAPSVKYVMHICRRKTSTIYKNKDEWNSPSSHWKIWRVLLRREKLPFVVVAARTFQKSTDGFFNVKGPGAFQRRRSRSGFLYYTIATPHTESITNIRHLWNFCAALWIEP